MVKESLICLFQKCVFLLNFLCEDECQQFIYTFNQSQSKVLSNCQDEDDYAEVYEGVYESVELVKVEKDPKVERRRLKDQQEKDKAEKKRLAKEEKAIKKREKKQINQIGVFTFDLNFFNFKKDQKKQIKLHEDKKFSISCPKPETFEHICHAGFNSNGFVIEGMDISVFQDLIKQAGISNDLVSQFNANNKV